MAAHILTGVKQVIEMLKENPETARPHIQGAVNMSCWTEDDPCEWSLDGGVWEHLNSWLDGKLPTENLLAYLEYARIRLTETWEKYNKPTTREAWNCARWPDLGGCSYYLEHNEYYEAL